MPDGLPEVFRPPPCSVADPSTTCSPASARNQARHSFRNIAACRILPAKGATLDLWPTASPCFARVWACATTPTRWGQRDCTALYGFCARPPTRITQGPVQMTNPPGQWQATFPAALPGGPPPSPVPRRRPETTREPAECLAAALIRLARALGCTGVYGSCPGQSPIRDKDASDWPASFDRPNPRSPEGWEGPAPSFACRKRPD